MTATAAAAHQTTMMMTVVVLLSELELELEFDAELDVTDDCTAFAYTDTYAYELLYDGSTSSQTYLSVALEYDTVIDVDSVP